MERMTAVVERTASEYNGTRYASGGDRHQRAGDRAGFTPARSEHLADRPADGDALSPGSEAPFHCGAPMTSAATPAVLPWAKLYSGRKEWACPCGFRQDADPAADPLAAVRAASGRLESLQWEMD